jgi:hypothetical protein
MMVERVAFVMFFLLGKSILHIPRMTPANLAVLEKSEMEGAGAFRP